LTAGYRILRGIEGEVTKMKLIIRESDLRNPFGVLAALARRCETTDYDGTDGWHVLMAAIKYLQKQGVEADGFREGKAA
jgi:hypothetical protein